jgi:hypothetical protein
MVGTTRRRISHFMNKFRKLGFIDYNGDVHVHRSLLMSRPGTCHRFTDIRGWSFAFRRFARRDKRLSDSIKAENSIAV